MTLQQLEAALAAANGKDTAVREALRACVRAMREGKCDDLPEMVELLLPYARHPNERVRTEIAGASDLFPDAAYAEVAAIFEKDVAPYVRAAFERATERRNERKKDRAKVEESDQALAEVLAEIEAVHGKPGRARAERAVRRAVGQLVTRLEHEVKRQRGPVELALVALETEIERPTPVRAALVEKHAGLRESLKYMSAILKRTRVYAQRVRPAFEEELLWEVVEQARQNLAQALGERAARVEMDIVVDRTLRVPVDRYALLQALENVLKNAVEASGERPKVSVRAEVRSRGKLVAITIADQGTGMSEEELARLFVPFASVKEGGTGVGMVTVRKMIEDVHGGELLVASTLGKGTVVTMVVPGRR